VVKHGTGTVPVWYYLLFSKVKLGNTGNSIADPYWF